MLTYNLTFERTAFGVRSLSRYAATMMNNLVPRARLTADVPADRFRVFSPKGRAPRVGDVVDLDQGFTGPDGLAMVLIYFRDPAGGDLYEAEVYESELSESI